MSTGGSAAVLPLVFASQFALLVGTSVEQILVSWLVFDRSGSSILLGWVGFLTGLVAAVAALLAGVWSDRRGPRLVLVATQAVAAAVSVGLLIKSLFGSLETSDIVVYALVASFCAGPTIPMQQSLLARLVARGDIGATVATNSLVYDLARLIGPTAGGFVLAHASVSAAVLLVIVCHGTSAGVLLLLRAVPIGARAATSSLRDAIVEGFHHVSSSRVILAIVGLSACVCVATSTLTVLMPVMADKLASGPQTLGLLLAALSAGAVGGSLFQRFHNEPIQLPRRIAVGAIFLGASTMLFAFASDLLLALVALLGAGLALNLVMTSCASVLLSITNEEVRGRVMSCFALSFMGVAPLTSLLAGFAAAIGSASSTIAYAAVVSLVAGVLFLRAVAPIKRLI